MAKASTFEQKKEKGELDLKRAGALEKEEEGRASSRTGERKFSGGRKLRSFTAKKGDAVRRNFGSGKRNNVTAKGRLS